MIWTKKRNANDSNDLDDLHGKYAIGSPHLRLDKLLAFFADSGIMHAK